MRKRIIVIGGGLAGSLICNELAKDFDVTLLELGFKNAVQYPKIEFIRKGFGAVKTVCIGGGGTTNLWHNGLIPINPSDIHSDEFKEVLSAAKRYTDNAASNLYFCKKSYSTEYDAALSDMSVVADEIGIFSDGIDCLLYPKKYERLKVNSNVEDFYNVSGIEFVIGNTRTKTVRYSSGTKHYSINSDIVIICAGTLGSPYLVKKVLCAAGYSSEKSGMGLADHPIGFVGKVKVRKNASAIFKKLSILDRGDYICRTAVRIKSECGRYTCCAFFRPALTMQNMLSIYKYKSLLGASKGIERVKSAFSIKLFHPDILAEIYSHLFGVNISSRIYNILMIFEQKRGNSSVSCDGSTMQVDWRITEEELRVYNSILKKLKEMLLSISDKLIIQMPITEEWLWSAAHHSGTIPLGSLPEGLIDKDLKLNRLDNVFVCDGSVIQEHSYANTGLTIGQLAMRLAEKVRCMLKNE